MADKVAIVGYGGTINKTPWHDEEWDIFTLNHRFDKIKRTTKHFDIHRKEKIELRNTAYREWLFKNQNKVLTAERIEWLPESQLYPKDKIEEKYGDFFTNSVSWMIAYAIEEGYKEIALYGIDLNTKTEYEKQRPSVLYFLGIARGMGIKLTFPDGCKLFEKDGLYWNG